MHFPLSWHHLTNNYMKNNPKNDYVVNVKKVEISSEICQHLQNLQIYPSSEQNSEFEYLVER